MQIVSYRASLSETCQKHCHVQLGKGGLGTRESRPSWRKATFAQVWWWRREQVLRCTMAIAQGKQGQWMQWKQVEKRRLPRKELWGIEAYRTSFLIRSVYDVPQTPQLWAVRAYKAFSADLNILKKGFFYVKQNKKEILHRVFGPCHIISSFVLLPVL